MLGGRETVGDVARNLERFVDAIMARTGPHEVVVELAARASIPVINGLTIREHPCQSLADLFTLHERFGDLRGRTLDVRRRRQQRLPLAGPDGRHAGHARPAGAPGGLRPERQDRRAGARARRGDGRLASRFTQDPREAVDGADAVYTDAWTSMGQEAEAEERRDAFARYQVNDALMAVSPDALVMHCLPAHRGEEITSDVMDGPRSIIFEQSENRLHAQKALLVELLAG